MVEIPIVSFNSPRRVPIGRRNYRSGTCRPDDRRDVSPKLRSSTSAGDDDEVVTAHGGSECSDDRGSAERWRVGRSTCRAHHSRLAQLRCEGETVTRLWCGGGLGSLKSRRQETYGIIEIGLIIDAGEPGRIG